VFADGQSNATIYIRISGNVPLSTSDVIFITLIDIVSSSSANNLCSAQLGEVNVVRLRLCGECNSLFCVLL